MNQKNWIVVTALALVALSSSAQSAAPIKQNIEILNTVVTVDDPVQWNVDDGKRKNRITHLITADRSMTISFDENLDACDKTLRELGQTAVNTYSPDWYPQVFPDKAFGSVSLCLDLKGGIFVWAEIVSAKKDINDPVFRNAALLLHAVAAQLKKSHVE